MSEIDDIISKEVGEFCKFYYGHLIVFSIAHFVNAAQIFLILFGGADTGSLGTNPHARNITNMMQELHVAKQDESYVSSLLQSIFFVGFMIGAVLFGQLADKFGRRWIGWRIHTLLVFTNVITGYCSSWKVVAVLRVIGGMGVGGVTVVSTILLQEFCGSKLWAINGNWSEFSFTIMMLLYMAFAYHFPGWKALTVYSTVPILFGYLFFGLTPESPRWLFSQGRFREAEQVMNQVARRNGNYTVDYKNTLQQTKESEKNSEKKKKYSFMDLFKDSVLRYRVIIFVFIWCTTAFVFYCITLSAGAFSPNLYTGFAFSAMIQLPAIPLTLFLMEKPWSGRRGALWTLMLIVAIPMFIMTFVPNTKEMGNLRLCLSLISKMGATGCFDLIYIYTPELFPTVVRNISLGLLSTVARIGSIIAPYVANVTLHNGATWPYFAYAVLCSIAATLALRLPETRGQSIINTIEEAHAQDKKILSREKRKTVLL